MDARSAEPGRTRLQPGDRVAEYEIEDYLARGGMAVLYRARDLSLRRRVALKLIAPDLASDDHFRARFIQESHLAASLDHPNIIPIFAAGESGDMLYLAMRYVEGMDLAKLFHSYVGPAPPRIVVAVLQQAAAALDAAHDAGLVHRDVKPANMLVASAGPGDLDPGRHVYLTDFGLTKRTSSLSGFTTAGHFLGTIEYVAPEQVRGEPVGPAGDIYSLACVAYEGLTGRVPHTRDNNAAILWAHVAEEPTPVSELCPWLSPQVDQVLSSALAKSSDDRPVTCSAFVRELAAALETPLTRRVRPPRAPRSSAAEGPPVPVPRPPADRPRRGRGKIWLAAAAALIVVALAVIVPLTLSSGSSGSMLRTYNATQSVAPIRLQYPASWQENVHRGFLLVLSPEPLQSLFDGGGWTVASDRARSDPAGTVGAALRTHNFSYDAADAAQTDEQFKTSDVPGSGVTFISHSTTTVNGHAALLIQGSIKDPDNTTSLRFRAYLISIGADNSRTLSMIFFALPDRFDSHLGEFDAVLKSAELSPSS